VSCGDAWVWRATFEPKIIENGQKPINLIRKTLRQFSPQSQGKLKKNYELDGGALMALFFRLPKRDVTEGPRVPGGLSHVAVAKKHAAGFRGGQPTVHPSPHDLVNAWWIRPLSNVRLDLEIIKPDIDTRIRDFTKHKPPNPGAISMISRTKLYIALHVLLLSSTLATPYPVLGPALSSTDTSSSKKDEKWEVAAKHGPTKDIQFETEEGTWLSLDVSPDGKHIAFDLLGDIYLMPIEGGNARLLLGGTPFETQPRFSPDGKQIAFTSDRGGCDNIWIMNTDGTKPHAVTAEKDRQTSNAVWTPDGQFIVARKHYRNTRSLGAGEMWLYHITGGDGVQLTKRRNWQQNASDPALSPDGRYLYYDEDVSPGNQYEYNRDPYGVIYVIQRFDRVTGKTKTFVRGSGGSVKPLVSPDGKYLAFIRRVRLNSVLFLRNLETDEEWPIYENLSRDAQETWAIFGLYPGYAWAPDSKHIVIWAKGKIRKINTSTKTAEEIPFNLQVNQTVTDALRFRQEVAPETFEPRMLRWVTTSPDCKLVVYNALGHLWIKSLPNGTPRRLTTDEQFEFYPSFSSDGKWVVYTTWSDRDKGSVSKVRSSGGKGIRLTTLKGTYTEPTFSHDASRVVFSRQSGDLVRGQAFGNDPGIYWVSADGGKSSLITEEGSSPRFDKTGERIFLITNEGEKTALISMNLLGGDRRVHLTSDNAQAIVPSPDGQWVAFTERYNSYVAPLPMSGQGIQIGPTTSDFPVKRLTRDAGMYLHWSGDSKTVYWSLGPELFSRRLDETFAFVEGAPDSVSDKPDTSGVYISFMAQSDKPTGSIALIGATIITMHGDEILQNGTIVIDQNRIAAVGPADRVSIPSTAKRIDVRGAYIMPGIIDVHAHGPAGSLGITPEQNWAFYAELAFGVTTEHDPSNDTEEVFASSELIRAGEVIGPRLYSTGTILYGAEGSFKAVINSIDDARSHLRRLKAVGAFSVKSYNQPRRDQRQQVIQAGRELNMMVVPEGGSTLYWNITQILDGHTGIEHSLPFSPLYKDVVTLFAKSGTGYTPTLVVSYGGLMGENYWYMHTNVWENERLLQYVPRTMVDSRSRRRMMVNDDDWNHIENSKSVKAIVDAGGKAQLGAHGQMQGLGAHWELWSLVQGGMTPMEAIRCATLYGAQYIGLDHDLGSIETGKLADLIVLNKNPLDDIRNSEAIRYVMVNGRLFDAATMNEVGNYVRDRQPFYWEGGMDPGTVTIDNDVE
jgi:Tol biopolymer transport system component/imidazolonepropionase-like amidohydrolase